MTTPIDDENEILPDDLKKGLDSIILDIDHRDQFARDRMMRVYKRNEYFWEGLQNIYFSEVAHDWRYISANPDGELVEDDSNLENKVVNIYKAHGEIIIAAVSQSIPATRFFPNDADISADIYTAQSFSRLAELIRKHNKAPFLFMKAIGLLYNQGVIAAYTYNDQDPKYGVDRIPHYKDAEVQTPVSVCPDCGQPLEPQGPAVQPMNGQPPPMPLGEAPSPVGVSGDPAALELPPMPPPEMPPPEMMPPEAMPPEMPVEAPGIPPEAMGGLAPQVPIEQGGTMCPNCGTMVQPMQDMQTEQMQVFDFEEVVPKMRQIIELYGASHVQIFPRARTLQQSGYLILNEEHDIAEMQEKFPHIADKIVKAADSDRYDRWARAPSTVQSDDDQDVCTCRQIWLRPWMFNKLGKFDDDLVNQMKQQFPEGMRAVYINDVLAEVNAENMDELWTVSVDPILDRIHGQPLANSIVPVQEMTNELFQLTIETIRYGIPETFVDSSVLDFQKYREMEVSPGSLYPVKAPAGGNIGAAFYTNKAAMLSREHKEFADDLQVAGQFVLGTVPSVYGGNNQGGSDTAAEYSMSRAQALQRLQIVYKMISFFWSELETKAVKGYAKNMKTDEKIVKSQGKNSFVNVWIRKAEMTGEVGEVEPELSEQFPLAWSQKRDVIMRLLELNNEAINEAMFHPENRHVVAELVGIPELTVPGDADRTKQLFEVYEMLSGQAQPVGINPVDGTPMLEPSVPVEEHVDDHGVHIAVIKEWCVSEIGMDQKMTNPAGYMNVIAHLTMHTGIQQKEQLEQMMMGAPPPGGPPDATAGGKGSPPKGKDTESIPAPRGVQNVP